MDNVGKAVVEYSGDRFKSAYVDGTLIRERGPNITLKIELLLKNDGADGVEKYSIVEKKFALGNSAHDGEYELEFFYLKPYRMAIVVKQGNIVAR